MKGETINNKYTILKILGKNLFSETYLARGKGSSFFCRYIIKKFRPILGDPQARTWRTIFEREASILKLLSGNNRQIPQLYEYFKDGEEFYLVREWIEGITLKQKVQQEGKLPESEVKEILSSILSVLQYIHQYGIVYRELSPSSVVLRQQTKLDPSAKSKYLPVPIYFGKVQKLATKTKRSNGYNLAVANRERYIPPESELEISSCADDLYSLGLIAVYLLTAKTPAELDTNPYNNKILWEKESSPISTNLTRIINRAISPHPGDRFIEAEAMLQALFPQSIDISATAFSPFKKKFWLTAEMKIVSILFSLGLGVLGAAFATLNFDFSFLTENQGDSQSLTSLDLEHLTKNLEATSNSEPQPQLNIPAFRVGVPIAKIKSSLGKPTHTSKGYWANSKAFLYQDFIPKVDLGYLSDVETGTIYQTEVSFDESVKAIEIEHTLKQLLMTDYSTEIDRQVEKVINQQSDKQKFRANNLEGVIQRNPQNQIYLAVWKTGFHQK